MTANSLRELGSDSSPSVQMKKLHAPQLDFSLLRSCAKDPVQASDLQSMCNNKRLLFYTKFVVICCVAIEN